jgi:hypothetical protein
MSQTGRGGATETGCPVGSITLRATDMPGSPEYREGLKRVRLS